MFIGMCQSALMHVQIILELAASMHACKEQPQPKNKSVNLMQLQLTHSQILETKSIYVHVYGIKIEKAIS